MRDQIADIVHPVISYGLHLKERLDQGEDLDLHSEQAALKGLLLSDSEARRSPEFGGEIGTATAASVSIMTLGKPGEAGRRSADAFLGIRYALVCWLDELFTVDSSWEREWNERKLELALYGTNERAWAFWEQARRAEGRAGSDALEVFFLCVMLGFRGEYRDEPAKLQTWATTTQARIAKSTGQEMPFPPELEPPIFVPPRHGRQRLQRMVITAAGLVIVFIPFLAYYVLQRFVAR